MPKRILVVDDDPDMCSYIRTILEGAGHDVRVAPDGSDAIRETHHWQIDLVLMDIRMRTLSGLWFCKALKDKAQTKNIPVVMVSAYSDPESQKKAHESGAVGFVAKPFRAPDLLAAVQTALTTLAA